VKVKTIVFSQIIILAKVSLFSWVAAFGMIKQEDRMAFLCTILSSEIKALHFY
jgi:hypothetical protein